MPDTKKPAKQPTRSTKSSSGKKKDLSAKSDTRRRTQNTAQPSVVPTTSSKQTTTASLQKDPPTPTATPSTSPQPSPTMPMPVTPHQLPARKIVPMVRTTYNTRWIRWLVIIGGVLVVAGIAVILYQNRSHFPILTADQRETSEDPYKLNITPTPTPDVEKLKQLQQRATPTQSDQSTGSAAIAPAEGIDVQTEVQRQFEHMSLEELIGELDEFIARLSSQGIDVSNLEAYRSQVTASAEQGDSAQARQWAVEAVVHATELEMVHAYYQ